MSTSVHDKLAQASPPVLDAEREPVSADTVGGAGADDDVQTREPTTHRVAEKGWRHWHSSKRPSRRTLAYAVLPAVALVLALAAGWLKWEAVTGQQEQVAAADAVHAASESATALLSYHPDTVEQDLGAAGDRLTGQFKDDYQKLITNVVIPGAKQKHISASARVPAAASVSASESHAVVLLFIDQTVVIGGNPPSDSASSVRVTLDKSGTRWLISAFEPV